MIKRISIPAIAAAFAMAATSINPAFAATKPPLGTGINTSHALANGLIGCWLFNENSGNTANDSTSSGNNGTLVGDTSWTTGNFNAPALSFDGNVDMVNLGSSVGHEGASAASVSIWFKCANAEASGSETLLGQSAPGPSNTIKLGRFGYPYERMIITVYTTSGSASAGNVGAEARDTVWHHVVGTYDGTNVKLYLDGTARGETGSTSGTIRSETTDLFVGADNSAGGSAFPGTIDHVMIWNRALDESEISSLFSDPFQMFEAAAATPVVQIKSGVTLRRNVTIKVE